MKLTPVQRINRRAVYHLSSMAWVSLQSNRPCAGSLHSGVFHSLGTSVHAEWSERIIRLQQRCWARCSVCGLHTPLTAASCPPPAQDANSSSPICLFLRSSLSFHQRMVNLTLSPQTWGINQESKEEGYPPRGLLGLFFVFGRTLFALLLRSFFPSLPVAERSGETLDFHPSVCQFMKSVSLLTFMEASSVLIVLNGQGSLPWPIILILGKWGTVRHNQGLATHGGHPTRILLGIL